MSSDDAQQRSGTSADQAELVDAVTRMSGVLLSRETVDTALHLVTTLAVSTMPGTVGAAVTVVDANGRRSMAASAAIAEQADALQYRLDEGPCLEAWREGHVVRLDDTATDRRWPRWSEAAGELGIRSVLSAPMLVGNETIGAMKVYSREPGTYGETAISIMTLFAQQAAILLANTLSLEAARQVGRQMTEALERRDLITRATGALLGQGAPDERVAFARLAAAAERSGHGVHEVAGRLLDAIARLNGRPPRA